LMSSPGMYWRCSAKSVEKPRYGDRCNPAMNPSTTVRATSSSELIRASTSGERKPTPTSAAEPPPEIGEIWLINQPPNTKFRKTASQSKFERPPRLKTSDSRLQTLQTLWTL